MKFICKIGLALLFVGLLLLPAQCLIAQDTVHRLVTVEAGFINQMATANDQEFIRGDLPVYGSGMVVDDLSSSYSKWFAGLKVEMRLKNERIRFASGIRYTIVTSEVGKSIGYERSNDYFYLLYNQNGTTTEYLRVNKIKLRASYLGIPVEIKYYFGDPRLFRLFGKVALDFSYLIDNHSEVVFFNDNMNHYEQEVIDKFDDPAPFLSNLYLSFGVKVGRPDKINASIEAVAPSFVLTQKSESLVTPDAGAGVQLNVYIPF